MSNIFYLSHKKIINNINNFKGTIFIFGYSETTLKSLKKISHKNIIILDNNPQLHGTILSKSIKICHVQTVTEDLEKLVVVWGNHCAANIKQLKKLKISTIYVDLDFGGYRVNPPKFVIQTPPNSHLNQNMLTQHNFIFKVMKELTLLEIPFETYPIADITEDKNYKNDLNTITFSYHTYGKEIANHFRYKESYLPGYITLDTEGFSGWHSLCKQDIIKELEQINELKAEKFYQKITKKYRDGNISKYNQESIPFDFPKKFFFFPLQLSHDVVASLSSFNQQEILITLSETLKDSSTKLLVKRHPKCNNYHLNKLLVQMQNEKKIILYTGSIHDAIKYCDAVIVSNSGVGFEALLHLKPVYSFGKSEYMSYTKIIKSLDDFIDLKPYKVNTKEIKKFLFYYLNKVCLHKSAQIRKKIVKLLKQTKSYNL